MSVQKNEDLLRRNDQKFLVLLLSLALVYFYFLALSTGNPQPGSPPPPKLQVNLNTADEAELLLLPGVGAILAKRILEYRTQHGPFQRNEDILLIQGIGPKKAEKILPMLKSQAVR
ncbi:MAG: helix-hairpin-helix domain-containing protein [Planctomycetaceae bacterium]|nr:helix-hairpin-helix domain-containing protein [Planctomycetaceae bacterium]